MCKVKVTIHESIGRSFSSASLRYQKILCHNGIECKRVFAGTLGFWEIVSSAEYFIFNFVHKASEMQQAAAILPVIEEHLGKKVLPDYRTRWHYDNKASQYYLCKSKGFPMVKTWIFWDPESALQWIQGADFPLVFKLLGGAGAENVILVKNRMLAEKLIARMFSARGADPNKLPGKPARRFMNTHLLEAIKGRVAYGFGRIGYERLNPYWQRHKDYVLFQPFLPNNTYDVRVAVIGSRAFAFKRYVRPNDFRASGSGLIDYDITDVDPECIRIALKISSELKFQSMAYDFILDEKNQPKIAEISYTYLDNLVYRCPGYFDADMKWYKGNYWPQFFLLQDLLQRYDLRQPTETEML